MKMKIKVKFIINDLDKGSHTVNTLLDIIYLDCSSPF